MSNSVNTPHSGVQLDIERHRFEERIGHERKMEDLNAKRVVMIITGLERGGAERMLLKLVRHLKRSSENRFSFIVISLRPPGPIGRALADAGITVHGYRMGEGVLSSMIEVVRILIEIRKLKPDVIHGWLPHGNFVAALCRFVLGPSAKIFMNVRQTISKVGYEKKMTALFIRLCGMLSPLCNGIVYNSTSAILDHKRFGYPERKATLIPNGFDLDVFKPSSRNYEWLRRVLSVSERACIVGMIARYHPMKDFGTFFRSASIIWNARPETQFVLIGPNVDENNEELTSLMRQSNLASNVHLLGDQEEVAAYISGFDVFILTSRYDEGFPNVLGEAMSSGVICITTDVGESARIVDECGYSVEPGNAESIAEHCIRLLDDVDLRKALGQASRQRIHRLYSLERVSEIYANLYLGNTPFRENSAG